MNKITVSAPGKLMLLGEHAVVYGRPCIVTAVGQRMKATVELTDDATFSLNAPDVQVLNYQKPMDQLGVGDIPKGAKFVEIAVKNFFIRHPERSEGSQDYKLPRAESPRFSLKVYKKLQKTLSRSTTCPAEDCNLSIHPRTKSAGFSASDYTDKSRDSSLVAQNDKRITRNDKRGIKISTSSEFSSQFGFGSSSASTVCVIKALSELTGANLDKKAIFDLAFKTVIDIQGKGSGFDVAAAVYGGTLYFITPGKVIEPLNLPSLPLIVGYSGIKADTVTLINQVSEKAKKYPEVIENIYDSIGKLVEQAKSALLNKDWQSIGELMNFNEGYLATLGVGSKKLADMIYSARDAGAFGAKLSGAGVGDCMIALAPEDKVQAVKEGITSAGGQVIDVEANVEGVRVE